MKKIISCICLVLAFAFSVQSQNAIIKKCKTCGKPIKECKYHGKHPQKAQTSNHLGKKTKDGDLTSPARTPLVSRRKTAIRNTDNNDPYPFRRVGDCPLKDELNPMDGGIILGWTTVDEAVASGGERGEGSSRGQHVTINHRTYWDHESDGIIESLYFTQSDSMPLLWYRSGLDFDMSYSRWLSWFKSREFQVYIKTNPHVGNHYSGGKCFQAEIFAYNAKSDLLFLLVFNYEKGTSSEKDPKTLYSITLTRNHRVKTRTTDYGQFATVNGVRPGYTTLAELEHKGMRVERTQEYRHAEENGFRFAVPADVRVKPAYIWSSEIIYELWTYEDVLPDNWNDMGYRTMSYSNWLDFFRRKGFLITEQNEQEITAVHPYYGIEISVDMSPSHYSIKYL